MGEVSLKFTAFGVPQVLKSYTGWINPNTDLMRAFPVAIDSMEKYLPDNKIQFNLAGLTWPYKKDSFTIWELEQILGNNYAISKTNFYTGIGIIHPLSAQINTNSSLSKKELLRLLMGGK